MAKVLSFVSFFVTFLSLVAELSVPSSSCGSVTQSRQGLLESISSVFSGHFLSHNDNLENPNLKKEV